MRLAVPLLLLACSGLLAVGCGDSAEESTSSSPTAPVGAMAKSCETFAADVEALRATAVPCDQARQVMYGWQREGSCGLAAGASRNSCLTRSYRCLGTRTDRGVAVSCARAGESIAFLKRG
jgi:hypothetical protein